MGKKRKGKKGKELKERVSELGEGWLVVLRGMDAAGPS